MIILFFFELFRLRFKGNLNKLDYIREELYMVSLVIGLEITLYKELNRFNLGFRELGVFFLGKRRFRGGVERL